MDSNTIVAIATSASVVVSAISVFRSQQAIREAQKANTLAKRSFTTADDANSIARGANDLAQKANNFSVDANTISKEALALQKDSRPGPWGPMEKVEGESRKFRVRNQSGRGINVLEFNTRPHTTRDSVIFHAQEGALIAYEDYLYFTVEPSSGKKAEEIEVAWLPEDFTTDSSGHCEWEYLYRNLV